MRAIFIDTETTGLPPRDRTITPDKVKGAWPDLVSLSWLISLDEKIITAQSHIIKPNGWTIGDGAIVGAGSVVVKNVDANTIVYGNPSRIKS